MHAIVAAGGDPPDEIWLDTLPRDGLVVAADSGLAHVYALGLAPDIVVGDFDSVDPAQLDRATRDGARIERHPTDKQATDLELALDVALDAGATELTVIGLGGGRTDHHLAGLAALADPAWAPMRIIALVGTDRIHVVHHDVTVTGRVASIVTLLAVGGPARGVTTTGLRWALQDAELSATSTLGVSNEIVTSPATVSVRGGTLFLIQPDGDH
ncbi:MAG: thiamine diphosphokinase [Acidimicrobiia bacterium]|nr:thiamine diphosphokinase [Acidimicrobiia bacterium]